MGPQMYCKSKVNMGVEPKIGENLKMDGLFIRENPIKMG